MTNILVQRMLEQIENDYGQALTLRTISASLGRQPAYLGRLFHRQMGSSVRTYLTRVRLEHAAALIRDGVKIEAVALTVGYRSKKNFYQRFRAHYGTTPVHYRSGGTETMGAPAAITTGGPRQQGWPIGTAPSAPSPLRSQASTLSPAAADAGFSGLGSIVRASNRAWRLAAHAQERMLQHFMRLRVGILLTDDAGRYIAANRAAMTVTGYSDPELCELVPSDLFESAPDVETRCVWQLMLRARQAPNATIRTKAGNAVGVYLLTLKNVLWGRREMSAVLQRATPLLTG
jgi:PAS domain S-box-containing protein